MKLTDEQFIVEFKKLGGCSALARFHGLTVRATQQRRKSIEQRHGIVLQPSSNNYSKEYTSKTDYVKRHNAKIKKGNVIVFSDAHFLPGEKSLAFHALLDVIKELKPKMIIANGDVFDGGSISRHPPYGWETIPTVKQELDAVQECMGEIEKAAKGAELRRTIGNHDIRFDRMLSVQNQPYKGVKGFGLKDHLPKWKESVSIMINNDLMIRHKPIMGGQNSAGNSAMKAGKSYIHGHLHRLHVTNWSDYNGKRWGVDCGTLADLSSDAFFYDEDAPKNWCSGFVVLTFDNHILFPPETVEVLDERVYFRGKQIL
jgi:hypothetical protein